MAIKISTPEMPSLEFHVERQIFTGNLALFARAKFASGVYARATNIIMENQPEGSIANPLAEISQTAAQQLIDQLWSCGLRPSEGSGSAGAMAATERHLADMQRLVFRGKP